MCTATDSIIVWQQVVTAIQGVLHMPACGNYCYGGGSCNDTCKPHALLSQVYNIHTEKKAFQIRLYLDDFSMPYAFHKVKEGGRP